MIFWFAFTSRLFCLFLGLFSVYVRFVWIRWCLLCISQFFGHVSFLSHSFPAHLPYLLFFQRSLKISDLLLRFRVHYQSLWCVDSPAFEYCLRLIYYHSIRLSGKSFVDPSQFYPVTPIVDRFRSWSCILPCKMIELLNVIAKHSFKYPAAEVEPMQSHSVWFRLKYVWFYK